MKNISIGVDLDSTLNNLEEVWILKEYNERFNDNLTKEDMVSWDVDSYTKPDVTKKQVFDILFEPGFFRTLDYRDHVTEVAFKWLNNHFDVYIVSSCLPGTADDKVAWMKDKFPYFDSSKFIACSNKSLINVDYLIDDGPHNIEKFPNTTVVMDAEYNKYVEADYRVRNWGDVLTLFGGLHQMYVKKERAEKEFNNRISSVPEDGCLL